jgi:hypothetical protein
LTLKERKLDNKKSKSKKGNKQKEDKTYEKIGEKTKKIKNKKNKENHDYEETAGISTPSKEILPSRDLYMEVNASTRLSASKELAHDKTIKVLYEIKLLEYHTNKIILLISFINKSESIIKELVFNIMDTSTLQLERRVSNIFILKNLKLYKL